VVLLLREDAVVFRGGIDLRVLMMIRTERGMFDHV
jgi:hypothetical protein